MNEDDGRKVIPIGNARLERLARRFRSTEDLLDAMACLSPRERDIIRLRFGLDSGHCRTVEEIAELYGVTPARVRFQEKIALLKLLP